jgi:hypothetical protein
VGDELQLVTLDTILYHVNGAGFLAPQYMLARTASGAEFEYGHYSFSPDAPLCCQVQSVVLCEPNPTCDEGNCPGPGDCACTGTGSCVEVTGSQCRGGCGPAEGCPGNNAHNCEQTSSTPVTCDCQ